MELAVPTRTYHLAVYKSKLYFGALMARTAVEYGLMME